MNMRTQEEYWDWFRTTLTEHSVNLKSIEKSMDKIEELLKEQNGRIGKTEVTLGWFKGITAMFSIIISYIFKRTL